MSGHGRGRDSFVFCLRYGMKVFRMHYVVCFIIIASQASIEDVNKVLSYLVPSELKSLAVLLALSAKRQHYK